MPEGHDPNKRAKDVGSDSPASKEAKEQTRKGLEGAPRGSGNAGGTDEQPAQSSGRSGPGPSPRARKHYEDEERPSEQGEGEPSPDRVRASENLQGQKGRSGSTGPRTGRGEDEATVHEK